MMQFFVEKGAKVPESIKLGRHHLIRALSTKELRISVAKTSHSVGYDEADVFLRLGSKISRPDFQQVNDLMAAAEEECNSANSRVGAALLTHSGRLFTSTEVPADSKEYHSNELTELLQWPNHKGSNAALGDFIDITTSSHAELIVILDSFICGERPKMLAVTRMPCLACCRLINQSGLEYTTYHHHRNFQPPSRVFLGLLERILSGTAFEVFEGYGRSINKPATTEH